MQFDTILANPPFQDTVNRNTTPHKLWIDFTKKELEFYLKEDGYLYQVSPASFSSPSSKILKLLQKYDTEYVNFSVGRHFDGIGSTFASYIVHKKITHPKPFTNIVVPDGTRIQFLLDKHTFYLPNDLCEESLSIHDKVMFTPKHKLEVMFDYVTNHNHNLKGDFPSLSKIPTNVHTVPVFHTNAQQWWSSKKQEIHPLLKVMWTRSGYTKPFYDNGTLGTTDMGYYIIVENQLLGENLAHNLNLSLFRYIFSTARWSGFGNELVFQNLPLIPLDKRLRDEEMFDYFGLNLLERLYVVRYLQSKKITFSTMNNDFSYEDKVWKLIRETMNSHTYMGGIERDKQRVQATAEVFTPTDLVLELIRSGDLQSFKKGKTILDPACGDGQFLLVAKLIKQFIFHMSEEEALNEIYGIDIMVDNVDLTNKRLGGGHIKVGNFMEEKSFSFDE